MTPEQFCYWLQGFAENSDCPPDENQWDTIKQHLDAVFGKVTPKTKSQLLTEEKLKDIIRPHNFDPHARIC